MRQLEFNFSNHYKILAEASGGKLTEEDVYNLETYGVKHPSEFAPDPQMFQTRLLCLW